MNFLYLFFEKIKEYFKIKYSLRIMFLTIFFLFFFQLIAQIKTSSIIKILVFDILNPFLIYLSMIFVLILMQEKNNFKKIIEIFLKTIKKTWWIIILKMLWNVFNIIIMGVDYSPEENSSLFPFFILIFIWVMILFLSSYVFPNVISKEKRKMPLGISSFIKYISLSYKKIFFGIFIAIFISGTFLIFSAFIFSYLSKIINLFLDPFLSKIFIEDFLSISTQVLYAHILSINAYIAYKEKNQ